MEGKAVLISAVFAAFLLGRVAAECGFSETLNLVSCTTQLNDTLTKLHTAAYNRTQLEDFCRQVDDNASCATAAGCTCSTIHGGLHNYIEVALPAIGAVNVLKYWCSPVARKDYLDNRACSATSALEACKSRLPDRFKLGQLRNADVCGKYREYVRCISQTTTTDCNQNYARFVTTVEEKRWHPESFAVYGCELDTNYATSGLPAFEPDCSRRDDSDVGLTKSTSATTTRTSTTARTTTTSDNSAPLWKTSPFLLIVSITSMMLYSRDY